MQSYSGLCCFFVWFVFMYNIVTQGRQENYSYHFHRLLKSEEHIKKIRCTPEKHTKSEYTKIAEDTVNVLILSQW